MIEVVWMPLTLGASEPILKAFDETGVAMRKIYAYHRTADGRRYFLVADVDANRDLVKGLGPAWSLKEEEAKADPVVPDKREMVLAELNRLGIAHKSSMKLDALIKRLPVESRGAFL